MSDAHLKKWLIPLYAVLTCALIGGLSGAAYLWKHTRHVNRQGAIQAVAAVAPAGHGEPTLRAIYADCAIAETVGKTSTSYKVVKTGEEWRAHAFPGSGPDIDPLLDPYSEEKCRAETLSGNAVAQPLTFATYDKLPLRQDRKWTFTLHSDAKGCAHVFEHGLGDVLLAIPPSPGAKASVGTLKNGILLKENGEYHAQGALHTVEESNNFPELNLRVPPQCATYTRVFVVDSAVPADPTPSTTVRPE